MATETHLVSVHFAAPDGLDAEPDEGSPPSEARALVTAASRQLEEYFAGRRTRFALPLAPAPTPFQAAVRVALVALPYGSTLSYGELGRRLGRPGASRAVGMANHLNPLGVVVPCHRVIGADGTLTGYAAGLRRKAWLIAHEARFAPAPHRGREASATAGSATP